MQLEQMEQYFFTAVLIVLAVLILLCFVRVVKGPAVADRIVGVNMIGTLTIMIIAVLSYSLNEGYLADVALIYAAVSFLAVVALTKIYMGVYLRQKAEKEAKDKKQEN